MHLVYAFFNLYNHTSFSIFDLLWVRNFNIEITVETDYDTYLSDFEGEDIDWKKFDYWD